MKEIASAIVYMAMSLMPHISWAQEKGIDFVTGLSWHDVQVRAKSENKFVFVDCYTTWCGPCKMMDKEVYTKDSVGRFFNGKFLSLRVQIDESKNDGAEIRGWYADASIIEKKYRILAYPTLLILSSDGTLLDKEVGFMRGDSLVAMATKAITRKTMFKDPFARYDDLVGEFNNGNIGYAEMPVLIGMAQQLNDTAVFRAASKKYSTYLLRLDRDSLYTTANLNCIVKAYNISVKSPFFEMFRKNASRIDKVVRENNFAEKVVDDAIQREYVTPITKIPTEEFVFERSHDSNYVQAPDWKKLFASINEKYGNLVAKRNVLAAKVAWYQYHREYVKWAVLFNKKVKEYGTDTTFAEDMVMNANGWDFCLYVTDRDQLRRAIQWMWLVAVRAVNRNRYSQYSTADTYANLLYKAGFKEEGLHWEQSALSLCTIEQDTGHMKEYQERVKKMQLREPAL